MPWQPTLLATRGGVLVYDVYQNVYPQPALFPVTELNPATGKTVWRVKTADPVSAVWSSLDGPAIVIATVGRTPRLIVADPVQHLVRWSAKTSVDTDTAPLIWFNQLLYLKRTTTSTATLVDRDTSSGKVRWSLPVPSALPRYLAFTGNGTWLLSYGQVKVPGKAGALVIGLTGTVVAKVSLPVPAQAPPAVTAGHDTLLQLDTLDCAISTVGSAAVGTRRQRDGGRYGGRHREHCKHRELPPATDPPWLTRRLRPRRAAPRPRRPGSAVRRGTASPSAPGAAAARRTRPRTAPRPSRRTTQASRRAAAPRRFP